MADEAQHYELAKRHVAEAEERIDRQRGIIATLSATGHDVSAAQDLLVTMEVSLEMMRAHLRQIESELACGSWQP
jgi:hypothetical protein